ncbi:uncharacterized protein METZ01_LOCUS340366 [marine metagenome]|uniref:DUF2065 domain-containing protein n=1 Tax=marine metagenome TaxID=408172 RepID=A0A382QRR5_9ZZZZ
MLKFILFGIGFVLLFEGLVYFFFANKVINILQIISVYNTEKIKLFSTLMVLLGVCLIYFTFKYYEFK